jgi:hypothetical protein
MPKKKKSRIYFTQETEDAIIEYNKTNDADLRNIIYKEKIQYPFEKLAENIFNTFKFSYFDVSSEDVQREVVSNLIEKIHMYQEGKGKAFSYFSIVAKNYLILKNNFNYRVYKKTDILSSMPDGWNIEDDFVERELAADYSEFKQLMLDWWDKYLTVIFIKKRDIQIADSILELFRRSDFIENFNKKHLYLLVREMTDCKTHYITKVVNTMKEYQIKMLNEYLHNGTISIVPETEFWEGEYLYETEHIDEGELEYYDE